MRLTFGWTLMGWWWMKMTVLLMTMLSAISCATVGGWQHDSDPTVVLSEGDNCSLRNGDPGVCKLIETCQPYAEGLRKKTIAYNSLVRCSFIGINEVICCPPSSTPPTTPPITSVSTGLEHLVVPPVTTSPSTTTTTRTTTTTPTTTTMRPIIIGDVTITGNEQFIDLSKVLRRTTTSTTTTRRPQQNNMNPTILGNIRQTLERNLGFNPINNHLPQGVNNIQWPGSQNHPRQSILNIPTDPRHIVRFTTTTTTRRPQRMPFSMSNGGRNVVRRPQLMPVNSDAEWFNPLAGNDIQGPTSSNMVQFPTQSSTTNANPIASFTDPFAPFQFRPGSNDDILVETSTMRTIDNNELQDADEWGWGSVDTATPRTIPTTTTTTTTTIRPQIVDATPILEDWMMEALRDATTSTIPTTASTPTIGVVPFSVTPMPVTTSTVETVVPRNLNERPSQAACRRFSEFNPATLTFHILDGIPVNPGDYPHMGGLIYPVGGGSEIDVRCGSSLISERYALTAAHCVNDPLSLPTTVRLGVVVWNSPDMDILPVDVEIENITIHPEYLSHLRYHDIALIRLRRNVDFTPFIRPACLYSDMNDIDSTIPLVVIGWGVTNVQTRARSEMLLMTNVTSVPLQECNATHIAYGVSRSYRNGLNEGHYCAFDPELKKDACQSDSGGPLQLVENKSSTIVGIVSFGLSCGSAVPSVYARVAFYLNWIESVVWPS